MDGKHIVVVGGTQFMGRVLVELLASRGAEVTLINR